MQQIHEIQRNILKKLIFSPKLHYLEMKPETDMENSKFDFHLKQLMKEKIVEKKEDFYHLTNKGKTYVARIDTEKNRILPQALNIVWLLCTRNKKINEILIYERHKQPYYGCQGFPAGKIDFGEKVIDAAKRELESECGLKGSCKLKAINHYITFGKENDQVVQDKFLYLCHFQNPTGKIIDSYEGIYKWIPIKDLKKHLKKPFSDINDYLHALDQIKPRGQKIEYKEFVEHSEVF